MQFPDSWFEDEVRDGFYVPALMKQAWAAHMEVLHDVARICERHHIRWFADFGTMLGAVRHRGFIPWDDDMDICMLPDDYIRFNEIAEKELPDGCYIPRGEGNDFRLITTVWSTRDICTDQAYLQKYHGFPFVAGVDIFPVFYVPSDPELADRQKQQLRFTYRAACSIDEGNQASEEAEAILSQVEEMLGVCLDRRKALKDQLFLLVKQLFLRYTAQDAQEAAHGTWFLYDLPRKYPLTCFRDSMPFPFETMQVPVPAGYDVMLTTVYGDYMSLIRSGNSHAYPFYDAYIQRLEEEMAKQGTRTRLSWHFCEADLEKTRETTLAEEFALLADSIHSDILHSIERNDFDGARTLLESCQGTAVQIGLALERADAEGAPAVGFLEEYCEQIWQLYNRLGTKPLSMERAAEDINRLQALLRAAADCVNNRNKKEIVFLPCRVSQWRSMEPAWRAAVARPDLNVYVIPVPYFYKRAESGAGEICCDLEHFPNEIPVMDYNSYDFKNRRPDMIIIQVPYDQYNPAFSVHPFFYSKNLKRYTDLLVYMPGLALDEAEFTEACSLKNLRHYIAMPALVHADETVVPSEDVRKGYIDILTNYAGEATRTIWEEKITCNFQIPFLKTR